ncbi:hypothetical protein, partial [Catenibacterium sp.]|uniref:hypothetical protein n=1 Tax=Catenibacterium sp. TaxID=2049022 RepID=UPI00258DC81B
LGTPPAFILSQDQTLHEICEELMFSSSIKCFQINLTCICSVFNVLSALLTGVLTYTTIIHFLCKDFFGFYSFFVKKSKKQPISAILPPIGYVLFVH